MTNSSKKIKVLMAGPDPNANGGIASVAKNYLNYGLADLCDLKYLITTKEGSKFQKAQLFCTSYRTYVGLIAKYDVLHLHVSTGASFFRKYLLAQRALKEGVPYIVHLHSGKFASFYENGSPKKQGMIREFLGNAATAVVLSEEWCTYLVNNRICPASAITILHNAVLLPDSFSSLNNKRVLFLGKLDSNKSPDVLLRAGAKLYEHRSDFMLVFAGDGEIEKYESLANDLDISAQCEFLGWVSKEKEQLFSSCSVFCLPSKAEGMPMSLLEAMAHGLAVIATPVGGIPQVIKQDKNGILMPLDDVNYLAKALNVLFDNFDLRERLGKSARLTIKQDFDMQVHLGKLIDIYSSILTDYNIEN